MRRNQSARTIAMPGGVFLSFLTACMVFIASIAVTGFLIVDHTADTWTQALRANLTIRIEGAATAGQDRRNVEKALAIARSAAGVVEAVEIPEDEVLELLAPWLGSGAIAADLPMPRLIAVRAAAGGDIDAGTLRGRLRAEMANAELDDHGAWLGQLTGFLGTIETVLGLVVLLIVGVTIAAVISSTGKSLELQNETIELMHLMGARDSYIAQQFARHICLQTLAGGVLGTLPALVCLYAFASAAGSLVRGDWLAPASPEAHIVAIAAIPVSMTAIAVAASWLSVMRTLRRKL